MRTTITLDSDVARKARAAMARQHKPFKQIVNEAMRAGLQRLDEPPRAVPYRTRARSLGLRRELNIDNIQDLLSKLEGEDAR